MNHQDIPFLDDIVLQSLDLFATDYPPTFNPTDYKLPFVVGSGNAYNTGVIIFANQAAIFADESNMKTLLPAFEGAVKSKLITQAVVLSASGGKDSVWEIELAKQYGLHTTLITTKATSPAAQIADKVYTFKSIDEPYTYNTSTYMGMILGATHESIADVKKAIESLKFPDNFDSYESYSFVLPDKFSPICPMLDIKRHELFGPKVSLRAFPQGHARHAKFVVRDKGELVISLNEKNEFFGVPECRWDVSLPENGSYAMVMAVTYFIVGKIQRSKPQYFKENVEAFTSDYGPKAYGANQQPFTVIVPGTK
jgi:hypothetical protein